MKIHIARSGEVIGEFSIIELRVAVKSGMVSEQDFAWAEGWLEWRPVGGLSELVKAKEEKLLKVPNPPQAATEKQLAYIKTFGEEVKAGLTKAEASALLDKLTADPQAREKQQQLKEEEISQYNMDKEAYPSFYLKIDIDEAREELESAIKEIESYSANKAQINATLAKLKANLANATEALDKASDSTKNKEWNEKIKNFEEQIRECEEELLDTIQSEKDDKEGLKEYKQELTYALQYRIDFWKDTFRENPEDFSDAWEALYTQYGQFLKIPSNNEISEILDALDMEKPGWDKGHVSAFFLTYQSTHTDRARKSVRKEQPTPKRQGRKGKGKRSSCGCLIVVALLSLLYLLFRFLSSSSL